MIRSASYICTVVEAQASYRWALITLFVIYFASARHLGLVVQDGDGRKLIQNTTTLSEALAVLKSLLQQGITINS